MKDQHNQSAASTRTMSREPETLTELKAEILRQLKMDVLTVTIKLTEGDSIHELLESITDGIEGTAKLNRDSSGHKCDHQWEQFQLEGQGAYVRCSKCGDYL